MPDVTIKDLPAEVHRKLEARAAANRRSLSQEAIVILEEALFDRAGPPTLETVDALRQTGARELDDEILEEARNEGRS
jgi:plasmid stability protein